MKRLLLITTLFAGIILCSTSTTAQDKMNEDMLNAQLRFIKENANLTKREYQKFAKIYIEYNNRLFELNSEQQEEIGKGGYPFIFGTPTPPASGSDYMKKWKEINDDYLEKLSDALPDSTRAKIGKAQWELGQKIWSQLAERNRQIMERQMQNMQMYQQMIWKEMAEKRFEWRRNFKEGWQIPDSVAPFHGPGGPQWYHRVPPQTKTPF